MEKVTKIRIKKPDGSFTSPVPIGANSENITTSDGSTLEQILGGISLQESGSIMDMITTIKQVLGYDDYSVLGNNVATALLALKMLVEQKENSLNNKINFDVGEVRKDFNTLSAETNQKISQLNYFVENRVGSLQSNITTRMQGIQTNNAAIDSDLQDLEASFKILEGSLISKIDGARVDDQGYLYLMSGDEVVVGPLGPFNGTGGGGGGTGGGGGASNNAVLTMTNVSGWIAKSIAQNSECNITCSWSSIEDDTPTGDGIVKVYINGVNRQTIPIQQGEFTVRIGNLLNVGKNSIKLTVNDVYGNARNINYTVSVIRASITSSFNTNTPFSSNILFPYVPQGVLEKTIHFILNDVEIGQVVTSTSGRQLTYTIPKQAHGTYTFEVYFTGQVEGVEIQSNHLYYNFSCIDETSTEVLITSTFTGTTAAQYSTILIPYKIYDPLNPQPQVQLIVIKEVNGQPIEQVISTGTADRTDHFWSYRVDGSQNIILKIKSGQASKEFPIQVIPSTYNIQALDTGLELYLTTKNRNNNEQHPEQWSYENISASLTGFNFVSNGWVLDDDNNTVLRVTGNARVNIPFKIFQTDFRGDGKTIEIEFATRDVRNYDTDIITSYSGNRGIKITAQNALIQSEQSHLSTQFKENEHVRLAFVVQKNTQNSQTDHRLMSIYINGIRSGVLQYSELDHFNQLQPVGITIGSNECTTDIYNIRVYNTKLNDRQIVNNWIADTQNVDEMLARYQRNNIFDTQAEEEDQIIISKLPEDLPYMIIEGSELPPKKGDKRTVKISYVDPADQSKSFTATAEADVQGTSSQYYSRKNYKIKYKNGFTLEDGTQVNKYALRGQEDSIPTKTFTMKADVASSEGANNVELARLYNDTCPYKTSSQLEDSRIRQGIDGFPIVMFWDDGTKTTFLGKYNFNNDKGTPEVFGFVDGDESWEILNNTSDRVVWKSDDFFSIVIDKSKEVVAWTLDFEARFPDTDPPYQDVSQLREFASWVKSTDTTAATNEPLSSPVTYQVKRIVIDEIEDSNTGQINYIARESVENVTYTQDTEEYRLMKFKNEVNRYVELDSSLFYYLFTELFLMIDSRAKNAFPSFMGSPTT